MSVRRELAFRAKVKTVSAKRVITAGPVTAAELGVPVGTVIAEQTVKWHRNPIRQLTWRIKNRDFRNRIKNPSKLID